MTANNVRMSAKFAPYAMYAHRLWITLWMSLGHPGENRAHPGGNAAVTPRRTPAAHSLADCSARAGHSHCARSQHGLPGRIRVIPGIHRPYDDYQSCNDKQIQTKVGKRPSGVCRAPLWRCGPYHSGDCYGQSLRRDTDQIRRGDR